MTQRGRRQAFHAKFLRVLPSYLRGTEQDVPEEQQVAVVALVVRGGVRGVAAMVGVVRGGRGDGAFHQPHEWRQRLDAIQRAVPGEVGVGRDDNREFHDEVAAVHPA